MRWACAWRDASAGPARMSPQRARSTASSIHRSREGQPRAEGPTVNHVETARRTAAKEYRRTPRSAMASAMAVAL
jgi:hypothetical protein